MDTSSRACYVLNVDGEGGVRTLPRILAGSTRLTLTRLSFSQLLITQPSLDTAVISACCSSVLLSLCSGTHLLGSQAIEHQDLSASTPPALGLQGHAFCFFQKKKKNPQTFFNMYSCDQPQFLTLIPGILLAEPSSVLGVFL